MGSQWDWHRAIGCKVRERVWCSRSSNGYLLSVIAKVVKCGRECSQARSFLKKNKKKGRWVAMEGVFHYGMAAGMWNGLLSLEFVQGWWFLFYRVDQQIYLPLTSPMTFPTFEQKISINEMKHSWMTWCKCWLLTEELIAGSHMTLSHLIHVNFR